MPIYEFYCESCNTIFSFFSRGVNTDKRPMCPRCKKRKLRREISLFAATGRAKEGPADAGGGPDDLPVDPARLEGAMEKLAGEAERMDENDPRQAADLMRKLSDATGMKLGPGMQEALQRMESGEDPEAVEAELGERLEQEEPFLMPGKDKAGGARPRRPPPARDGTLYDL